MTASAALNGITVTYTDAGRGLPLVLLHGFPFDRSMWDAQVEALSSRFRLVVPDLRGFGGSVAPPGPVSMDRFADDVAALLDHLELPRAAIGGLSMGGYVAFAFARRHPGRVQALVFCDTKAVADTPEARKGRAEMAAFVADRGVAPIAERMLPRLLAPATLQGRPDVVERVRGMILRASVNAVLGALAGMADRPDSTPLLSGFRCPVLFLVGAQDALSPPEEAEGMCARVPGGRRVVVPEAGHLSPMENPAVVNEALAGFLGSVA
jgi:pimeloyl-ACP methyl ester carboxylesterase